MGTEVYDKLIAKFGPRYQGRLSAVTEKTKCEAQEIRIRAGRALEIRTGDKRLFASKQGETDKATSDCLALNCAEIRELLSRLCDFSLYSREDDLKRGFITVEGGHRVGVCGSLLAPDGPVGDYSSLNIRVAREFPGCADKVIKECLAHSLGSVLIAGAPGSGKTTIVRDLARRLASDAWGLDVTVIDERGEIAGVYAGTRGLDVGVTSDVLNGFMKTEGIETAVRALSPDVIVCDEIGGDDDLAALLRAKRSGVHIAATIHAGTISDVSAKLARVGGAELLFDHIALLDSAEKGAVAAFYHRHAQ